MNQLHDAHVQTREAVASFAASQDEIDMSRQRAGQHAPEAEAERLYHWALLDRIDEKKIELSEWVAMPAASISEIDRKKQGTSELRAELAALELQFNVPYQAAAQSPATPAPGGKRWTPDELEKLRAYREAHTMQETAGKFAISAQRIRQLLPSGKPKARPFAGLIHRMT